MIKVLGNVSKAFFKNKIGVSEQGIDIMMPKTKIYNIHIQDLPNQAAAILKQDMLSIGGDVAVNADVVRYKIGNNSCLIIGTKNHFSKLIEKLKKQPYGLTNISDGIERAILNHEKEKFVLNLRDDFFDISETKIMGILNITDNSFFDGGRYKKLDAIIQHVSEMISCGADILDIGAESSKPGAEPVSLDEELNRLMPVLRAVRKISKIPISIDTYKSEVARACLDEGADIINDIFSLTFDSEMVNVLARYKCPVVLMHMQKTPVDMQESPKYTDVVDDIIEYLDERINFAEKNGINRDRIIIDPGIGFGKTVEHNLEILRRIEEFKCLGQPILVGASRKNFIGKILDLGVDERLSGTLAISSILAEKKINILRVHDVKENKNACGIINSIKRQV